MADVVRGLTTGDRPQPTWLRAPRLAVVQTGRRVALARLADPAAPPLILEGSAADVWQLLEAGPRTVDEIVEGLEASFVASPDSMSDDVADFLAALEAAGLVHATV